MQTLLERAKAIYEKYDFEYLTVSKRIENSPPEGFNRGDTCIHILRSLFGVDWEVSFYIHGAMAMVCVPIMGNTVKIGYMIHIFVHQKTVS